MSYNTVEAIKEFYRRCDDLAARQIEKGTERPTCQRGCTACCHYPVVVVAIDGLVIAQTLLSKPGWDQWLKTLIGASEPYCREKFDRGVFTAEWRACPFLDQESRDCKIYDVRPAACRYHYSIDDPVFCGRDHPKYKIRYLNFLHIENMCMRFSYETLNAAFVAPLPLMVAWMMTKTNPARKRYVHDQLEGVLPDPAQWCQRYVIEDNIGAGDFDHEVLKTANELADKLLKGGTDANNP